MSSLPAHALGLGLRTQMIAEVLARRPAVDFFEVISENYLGDAALPARRLREVRALYPLVLHGVSLNLLGAEPLDERYLDRLARLADAIDAPYVSDHLCWTAAGGVSHHDLLPTPYTRDLIDYAASRAHQVQSRLQRPFALENLSSYVQFAHSDLTEWDFYSAVVEQAGCHYMLDLNNVYVSSQNHGFDPYTYLGAMNVSRVVQVHLAGHTREPSGTLIDTHDHPVHDAVWQLYHHAWKRGGPFPTLLEWDAKLPPLEALLAELNKARQVRAATPAAPTRRSPSTPAAPTPHNPSAPTPAAPTSRSPSAPTLLAPSSEPPRRRDEPPPSAQAHKP